MSDKMTDPLPENIDGKKVVTYENQIHHKINWGYLAVGVGLIALAYVVQQNLGSDDGGEQESQPAVDEDAEEIEVTGSGGLVA